VALPTAEQIGVDSVFDVLTATFHLEGEQNGDEYIIQCPDPKHPDDSPSCGVNLCTGLWHCFACGVGGDLAELGLYVFNMPRNNKVERRRSRESVLENLKPHTPSAILTSVQRKLAGLRINTIPKRKSELKLPGPYREGPLDELLERGFTERTLRKWGVRFCLSQELQGKKGLFTIKNSVAIPVRDESGGLLCWCYRATKASPGWQPRYLYTPEVDTSNFWFGPQHHKDEEHVVVVEGAIDAMWLDQLGIPAYAQLGSNAPEHKILQLQRFRSITLLGDRDLGGATLVNNIGKVLGQRMPVYVARYSKWMPGGDPQDMHPVDVEIMLERSIPWTIYKLRNLTE
jgi:hypothetical protein